MGAISSRELSLVTAEGLKALYETELRYHVGNPRLAPAERQGLWKLFSASRRMPSGELREQDHEGLWLWSDLHLSHAMTISVFGRPYSTPKEMDDALFGVWRRLVDPADTVVILGDVAIGGLSGSQLKRFRAAPGRKLLVLGNHEFDGTVSGHREGFEEAYSTVYVPGRPELLLTHVPLRDVPDGCVNVHGHVHRWAPSETRTSTSWSSRRGIGRGRWLPFAASRLCWSATRTCRGGPRPSN